MDFGAQIRKYRKNKDLTLKQLGDIVGVSPQAISQYERNEREPNMDMLNKIAEALDVSKYDLLKEVEELRYKIQEADIISKLLSVYGYKIIYFRTTEIIDGTKYIKKDELLIDEYSGNKDEIIPGIKEPYCAIKLNSKETITLTEYEFEYFVENIKKYVEFELYRFKDK